MGGGTGGAGALRGCGSTVAALAGLTGPAGGATAIDGGGAEARAVAAGPGGGGGRARVVAVEGGGGCFCWRKLGAGATAPGAPKPGAAVRGLEGLAGAFASTRMLSGRFGLAGTDDTVIPEEEGCGGGGSGLTTTGRAGCCVVVVVPLSSFFLFLCSLSNLLACSSLSIFACSVRTHTSTKNLGFENLLATSWLSANAEKSGIVSHLARWACNPWGFENIPAIE